MGRSRVLSASYQIAKNIRLSVFLAVCLILGGTSQNIIEPKIWLYLLSLVMIGWSITQSNIGGRQKFFYPSILIFAAFLLVHILYILPLPTGIWTNLAGRDIVAEGFRLTDTPLPWMPLSLNPERSIYTLLDFLPPLAIITTTLLASGQRENRYALYTLLIFSALSVLLGLLQISGISRALYFYKYTNLGSGVGFFSNANHQATLLLMLMPLALYFAFRRENEDSLGAFISSKKLLGILCSIVFFAGIALASSVAGYGLLVVTFPLALFLVAKGSQMSLKIGLAVAVIFAIVIAIDFLVLGQQLSSLLEKFTTESNLSRSEIARVTWEAKNDFGVFGTGPGSFHDVYRLYEDRGTLNRNFIPQAHNDYLQTILEFGVLGWLFIGAFLLWFFSTAVTALKSHGRTRRIRLLLLLSLFCVILHSVVDYPLRTIAISTIFTYFVCLIELYRNRDVDKAPRL